MSHMSCIRKDCLLGLVWFQADVQGGVQYNFQHLGPAIHVPYMFMRIWVTTKSDVFIFSRNNYEGIIVRFISMYVTISPRTSSPLWYDEVITLI